MFGPDTELLSGRHVIFIDLGMPTRWQQARALFAPTMAEQVVMGLDEHDRLIAYVLGLSHALNIAFFTALAESGEAAPRLVQLSSTTFDAQFDIASDVAEESPELYYEIQHLNDYGAESLDALARAVDAVRSAVSSGDQARFTALMRQGHEYVKGRRDAARGGSTASGAGRAHARRRSARLPPQQHEEHRGADQRHDRADRQFARRRRVRPIRCRPGTAGYRRPGRRPGRPRDDRWC